MFRISLASNAAVDLSVDDVVDILAIATIVDIEHFNEGCDVVMTWCLAG